MCYNITSDAVLHLNSSLRRSTTDLKFNMISSLCYSHRLCVAEEYIGMSCFRFLFFVLPNSCVVDKPSSCMPNIGLKLSTSRERALAALHHRDTRALLHCADRLMVYFEQHDIDLIPGYSQACTSRLPICMASWPCSAVLRSDPASDTFTFPPAQTLQLQESPQTSCIEQLVRLPAPLRCITHQPTK